MTAKPSYWGDALQELVYCVRKYGEYRFDNEHRSRLIAQAKCFEELSVIQAIFQLSNSEQEVDETILATVSQFIDKPIPNIDRLRHWPWDEDYGADE